MADFAWEARSRTGELRKGVMEADSQAAVENRLRQQQLNPVKVKRRGTLANIRLLPPNEFCNPANVNGNEPGAENHATHYTCYDVALPLGTTFKAPANVWINDEFLARKLVMNNHVWEFCVPGTVTVIS